MTGPIKGALNRRSKRKFDEFWFALQTVGDALMQAEQLAAKLRDNRPTHQGSGNQGDGSGAGAGVGARLRQPLRSLVDPLCSIHSLPPLNGHHVCAIYTYIQIRQG